MERNHQYNSREQGNRNYDANVEQKNKRRSKNIMMDFLCTISLLAIVIVIIVALNKFMKEPEDKVDNVILRHYTEVMKDMDDEPEDISLYKYQAKIPKTVQEDIDKMLEMGEDASIVYYNDQKDKLIIEPSEDSESGYKVRFERATNERYDSMEDEELKDNVSFYKAGDTLVIYGGFMGRMLSRYHMDNKEMERNSLDNKDVDLYGTNVKYDDKRELSSYFTLIRKDTEFSFYHLGEKVYTKNFLGGEISEWSYYYITTTSKDCYNVYYSENPQKPWIEFYKVAENVDKILEDEKITIMDEDANKMNFPIFKIGNKKYAQIPNPVAERSYGQNYGGRGRKSEKKSETNFTSELVEISASNSSKVELKCNRISYDDRMEWILYYYFQVGDRECFFRKRINGLDSEVAKLIPEEKIKKFDGKVISPDEVKKYINQLKLLHDEYTDNKF